LGDNIKGMQMRVAQIVTVHPKKVFIMAGTNSLSYKKDVLAREYDQLIMAIKDSLPQA
jgi:lysophospholipase L1-like esterase